jgi:hypothetical protein
MEVKIEITSEQASIIIRSLLMDVQRYKAHQRSETENKNRISKRLGKVIQVVKQAGNVIRSMDNIIHNTGVDCDVNVVTDILIKIDGVLLRDSVKSESVE